MDTLPAHPTMTSSNMAPAETLDFSSVVDIDPRSLRPPSGLNQARVPTYDNANMPLSELEFIPSTYMDANTGGNSSFPLFAQQNLSQGSSFDSVATGTQNQSTGFRNYWQYPGFSQRSFADTAAHRPVPPHPSSASGEPHTAHQPSMFQYTEPRQYQLMMQSAMDVLSQEASLRVPAPPGHPYSFLPNSYAQRQTGVLSMADQRRGRPRNQALAGVSRPRINAPRVSSHGGRYPSRPVAGGSSNTSIRSPFAHYQRPPTTSSTPSPSHPILTSQQRIQVARSLRLTMLRLSELLRTLDAEDTRQLQMYDELLRRRYHQAPASESHGSSAPQPAEPDSQNGTRPEAREAKELMINMECRICMSQLVDTVILPCGHAVLCRWCADQYLPSSRLDQTHPKGHRQCPMCRTPVKQKVRVTVL